MQRRTAPINMTDAALHNNQPIPTVIVSRPGIMQQSLRTSVAACPWLVVVACYGDGLTAINHLLRSCPGILVIDSNLLDEEVDALLTAVKSAQPAIRCLALVRSHLRYDQVLANSADVAVWRNGASHDLQEALLHLARSADSRQA